MRRRFNADIIYRKIFSIFMVLFGITGIIGRYITNDILIKAIVTINQVPQPPYIYHPYAVIAVLYTFSAFQYIFYAMAIVAGIILYFEMWMWWFKE